MIFFGFVFFLIFGGLSTPGTPLPHLTRSRTYFLIYFPDDSARLGEAQNNTALRPKNFKNRQQNSNDKRVTQVFLTKKGYSLQSDLEEQFSLIGKVVEESLNPSDKVNISDSLSSLNWVLLKLISNK